MQIHTQFSYMNLACTRQTIQRRYICAQIKHYYKFNLSETRWSALIGMSEIHLLGMWTGRINENTENTDGVLAHAVVVGQTGHVKDQDSSILRILRILSPDRPARSQSLYRLSYPAHKIMTVSRWILLRMRNVSHRSYRKNQNAITFPKILPFIR